MHEHSGILSLILSSLAALALVGCGAAATNPLPVVNEQPETPDPPDSDEDPVLPPGPFVVVDTGQDVFFSDAAVIAAPAEGEAFFGQDAQYDGVAPSYQDNGDGTVTDLNTGLMWQQDPGAKVTFAQAVAGAAGFGLAGYDDWRLPTVKELYSLIDFRGVTGTSAASSVPYIDTDYFVFEYGDESVGERFIDSQWATSTEYVSTTMNGDHTMFGVNFADGRIKGYGTTAPNGTQKTFFCIYVRSDAAYGVNQFVDNGDGTVTDQATGLMWLQDDSGSFSVGDAADGQLDWEQALAWAEGLTYAGHADWRLPDAKELQGIVDYSRSPDTTSSAAIDPVFRCTAITAEDGSPNYGWYWTSTTHMDGPQAAVQACYVCFGEALGYMSGQWLDVHGAGCQRSDPKSGDPSAYPFGRGPQGDAIRIYNFVRPVRDAD
jgi:hypothetical protein